MMRYALRRLSFLPIILIAVSIFTFVLLRVLPTGDIADVIGGANATAEQKDQIRDRYGLNDPIFPVTFGGSTHSATCGSSNATHCTRSRSMP